jgi:hypothetical protein
MKTLLESFLDQLEVEGELSPEDLRFARVPIGWPEGLRGYNMGDHISFVEEPTRPEYRINGDDPKHWRMVLHCSVPRAEVALTSRRKLSAWCLLQGYARRAFEELDLVYRSLSR